LPNTSSLLGEGALRSTKDKKLYWVDIKNSRVHVYDPATSSNKTHQLDQFVGTIVLRKSGGALLGLHKGIASFDFETGKYEMIASPDADPRNRFNDGKCDPQGRFWAGTMQDEEEGGVRGALGSLYMVDTKKNVVKQLDNIIISNGIVWTKDSKKMYYIDSPTSRVDAFDFDAETGKLTNRTTAVTIPNGDGWPDGMTIDSDDNIWVAHWEGSRVTQWDPRTGKLLRTVNIPTSKVTSVAFGGESLTDLYVTTASIGDGPHPAGALFRVTGLGVRGVESPEFAG